MSGKFPNPFSFKFFFHPTFLPRILYEKTLYPIPNTVPAPGQPAGRRPLLAQDKAISAGSFNSFFLGFDCTDPTRPSATGFNGNGQLGDGTTTDKNSPVAVPGLTGVRAVAAGGYHSLFLKEDGTVWATGFNGYGQLGDGTTTDKNSPVAVPGLTGVRAVAAGQNHSLFLKEDGTVWATGFNGNGQLGDGTTTDKNSPVAVPGLTGVRAVAAGGYHSLFLKEDGTVWATGINVYGQLGDGTTTDKNSPVQVPGLTGVRAVAAGGIIPCSSKRTAPCGPPDSMAMVSWETAPLPIRTAP
ncbi:RCC1 domain-containing protein [Salmonirosea aquatica]|uniref:RCC1 domain-containing protein n=1 Tax=Salmonirosea aquatica TaxID=2654236 RepID=UPI0035716416